MRNYQCYYLDGERAGDIEHLDYEPRGVRESTTIIGSSNQPPRAHDSKPIYFRYLIKRHEGTYCVASQLSTLDSELSALEEAKSAGLKPY